jgi:hypothetical protein
MILVPLLNPKFAHIVRQVVANFGFAALAHFQEKWEPVFRPKMRQAKKPEHIQFPAKLNVL